VVKKKCFIRYLKRHDGSIRIGTNDQDTQGFISSEYLDFSILYLDYFSFLSRVKPIREYVHYFLMLSPLGLKKYFQRNDVFC
jgi:hypothetical protein